MKEDGFTGNAVEIPPGISPEQYIQEQLDQAKHACTGINSLIRGEDMAPVLQIAIEIPGHKGFTVHEFDMSKHSMNVCQDGNAISIQNGNTLVFYAQFKYIAWLR